MAKLTVEEVKDFGVLPEDSIIQVEVAECSPREVPGRDGKEGWTKLEFKFIVREIPTHLQTAEFAEIIGQNIFGSVPMKLTEHPDNKLRQWAEALLNMGELGVGFELDTDMLIGRRARARITQYKRRTDGEARHQVGGLLPLAGGNLSGNVSLLDPSQAPTQVTRSQAAPVQAAAPTPTPSATGWAAANSWDDDPPF